MSRLGIPTQQIQICQIAHLAISSGKIVSLSKERVVIKEMTTDFFDVGIRTISRYIEQNNEELPKLLKFLDLMRIY